jgi:hypothetical protein
MITVTIDDHPTMPVVLKFGTKTTMRITLDAAHQLQHDINVKVVEHFLIAAAKHQGGIA